EKKRRELVEFLAPYRQDALTTHPWKGWAEHAPENGEAEHRMPGGQSRWSQGKDLSWEPLRPELAVEVAYDHMQASSFRHTVQFRRWAMDKTPSDCTYAQLEVVPPEELAVIFAGGRWASQCRFKTFKPFNRSEPFKPYFRTALYTGEGEEGG